MTKTIERLHGSESPTHAVIWMHGLGATADDFVPVVPYLGLSPNLAIQFVFPQAPNRPITVNNGMVMPGWYDIKGMDLSQKEDLEGMQQSQVMIEQLIEQQVEKGIPNKNIILAGFSQGGAVAYYTAVRHRHSLAGVLALSTYLPFLNVLETEQSGENKSTPMMAMHGTRDPVVPIEMGRLSADSLNRAGYSVDWQEYPMEHNVIPEQLTDIGQWMNRVLQSK